jgi:signal transduction histidine kinase
VKPPRSFPYPAVLVLVTALYVLVGKLALRLAIVHASASPVWPPTGIALAALLILGFRTWPAIFVGAFIVNVTTAGSVLTSLGIAAGNTLEALLGAFLVARFANGRAAFERSGDTFRFAVFAGMVSPLVSATIGVISLALGGFVPWNDFAAIWLTWWLGDLGGALIIAPLLILWINDPRPRWSSLQILEALGLLVSTVLVTQVVFGWSRPLGGFPLVFLCGPLLIWAGFRFDPRVASAALFVLAAVAVRGAFASAHDLARWQLNDRLLLLQVFLGVTAATKLALAAVVAERRHGEAEVRATSEELREAVAHLEAFSHSISHDLRSPIGTVLNYTAVLEEDYGSRLDEEGVVILNRMRTSAQTAVRLLDQLVQFAWVGRHEGEDRRLDMNALAREAYAEVAAGGEGAADVEFHLEDLPPARGNAALLVRVYRNLFSNAVKFTRGRPGRRIEVGAIPGEPETTYFVRDNGMGFDPSRKDEVFQPFRRLTRAREYEGTGLGLAIVARIVRKHGGRIWAESDGTNGARFCFTLTNPEPET